MKKYLIYNLCILCSLFFLMSCEKEEIKKNLPESSIYLAARSNAFDYNFTNYPITDTEIIVEIKVNTIGDVKDFDRPFQMIVQDSSTAKEGVHFEFVEKNLFIPAGELLKNVQIRLLRHPDLQNSDKTLHLLLKGGADFTSSIDGFKSISSIVFRDQTTQPFLWQLGSIQDYLGTYSEKKFKLYQEIAGMPIDALDSFERIDEYFYARLKFWATLLKQYIDIQESQNNTILDEDGTPMSVGEYLY